MSHVQELFIQNCDILALPDNLFTNLQTLNYLSITGGSIDDWGFDCFVGLNIYPMDIKNPKGALVVKDTKILSGYLPNGVLFALSNLVTIELDNANVAELQKDMFIALTKMKHIDISRNTYVTVPQGLYDGLNALGTVVANGISWNCSCEDLWFLEFFRSSNISLYSDVVCMLPTDYNCKFYIRINV